MKNTGHPRGVLTGNGFLHRDTHLVLSTRVRSRSRTPSFHVSCLSVQTVVCRSTIQSIASSSRTHARASPRLRNRLPSTIFWFRPVRPPDVSNSHPPVTFLNQRGPKGAGAVLTYCKADRRPWTACNSSGARDIPTAARPTPLSYLPSAACRLSS